MVPFERALVSSYSPSIVIFPLSLHVSEIIAAFVLQHATFLPHLQSLPNFPMFTCEQVDGLWVTKSEGVRLIVLLLVFKISNLCEHNPPTSQTDRRTTYNSKTALCTIVHYSASRNKNRSAVAKVIVTSKLHLSMDHSAIGATVSLHLTNAQPPGMLPLFSAWPSVTFP